MKEENCTTAKPYFLTEWIENICDLETLIIQNKKSKDEQPDVVIVFFHGYGSNAMRTKKIAETILNHSFLPPTSLFLQPRKPVPTIRFFLPEAPYIVSDGVFSWWPMPNSAFAITLPLSGSGRLEHYNPQNYLKQCRTQLHEYLNIILQQHPQALFIIGGFSQGSLVATDLLLTCSCPRNPDVVLLMSTTLFEKEVWQRYCEERGENFISTTIFQTHGTHDSVLAYGEARYFYDLLCHYNQGETDFFSFPGGHDMSVSARTFMAASLEDYVYNHWKPPHYSVPTTTETSTANRIN